ncbi:hypothetical protein SODALDRAFT_376809 [Sodiomyces alkalinus F11]|uniref:Uncharacterized protein n=1 Tax=Sodiomyces alkalinus (strain CBS 110278 / VKM F-3762 / F11) TaxID=1314773 RepID=A0A3N2Q2Y1_SODAK|nr:hypothetical protein SODALDRAFT_376809 [Sodiomyces alkalinus F11]ROT41086.1 hypothetical protein SODALDRAFT_376809 [Sodiomyces alkalinus F11]
MKERGDEERVIFMLPSIPPHSQFLPDIWGGGSVSAYTTSLGRSCPKGHSHGWPKQQGSFINFLVGKVLGVIDVGLMGLPSQGEDLSNPASPQDPRLETIDRPELGTSILDISISDIRIRHFILLITPPPTANLPFSKLLKPPRPTPPSHRPVRLIKPRLLRKSQSPEIIQRTSKSTGRTSRSSHQAPDSQRPPSSRSPSPLTPHPG